ncbi:DinB family protein [Fontibacillus phaseoli]|uniref:DinB family protein n=1 Tax=Fontibacillus phaseoli TaxID=1416533 RepID=A0A369BIN2_9BACL|nr:DinB family protein [Fontibacillus phaseoli]RCX21433.1 DinB family protein [Fontibacillus phaseoli]
MSCQMVAVLQRHLEPALQMLNQLVELGPEEVWADPELDYWKHILHAITGIAFWFREEGEEFHLPNFNKDITPDFDKKCLDYPTKHELAGYIDEMKVKSESFFKQLAGVSLVDPCAVYDKFTKADVILMQIRHIQHHIGYCNHILSSRGYETAGWVG